LVDSGYDEIMHRIETYGYCHAGNRCGDLKIEALDEELFNQLKQVVDVILIEADGSKHLPLKYPNGNEPESTNVSSSINICVVVHIRTVLFIETYLSFNSRIYVVFPPEPITLMII